MWAPRGFRDLEIRDICFDVAGKHWLLFSRTHLHSSVDLGSPAESKSYLKGKAYISFDFFNKKILFISMVVID